jgi:nicotinamidase/pyrazinamidase
MASYDQSTALIVVDVQNDFADPNGSLYVPGGEAVVPMINEEIDLARGAGALLVFTQDWHPPSTPHFAKDGGMWPVHCVQDTWGAEFHPSLAVDGERVRKGVGGEDGYSGFTVADLQSGNESGTGLDELLHRHQVRRLVLAGLATDYCVKATALDGVHKAYDVEVLRAAVRAVDIQPGDGERALREMADAGVRLA